MSHRPIALLAPLIFLSACLAHEGEHAHASHDDDNGLEYENKVSVRVERDTRIIESNGIPNHLAGKFPNRNNPHTIKPQSYAYRMPAKPAVSKKTTQLGMFPFGIAVNGVVFDPSANEFWNRDRNSGWQYEPFEIDGKLGLDASNAHVQPRGAYHYHGPPTGLINLLLDGERKPVLIGYAADGFPIYNDLGYADPDNAKSKVRKLKSSYRLKKGARPDGPGGKYDGTFVQDYEYVEGLGDLDECNGRAGVTPEYPDGTYYYVLTDHFPFVPRQFRGTPDESFIRRGGGGRPPRIEDVEERGPRDRGPDGRRPPPPRD